MQPEWTELLARLRQRFIQTLDLLSILVFDAVILGFGYILVRLAAHLAGSGSEFFEAAREVSAGLFLLLYLIVVFRHVREFLKGS